MYLKSVKIKKRKLVLVSITALVIIGFGVWLVENSLIPAQVADEVLRPILGEKRTIELESKYFAASEQIKKIKSNFVKPADSPFFEDTTLNNGRNVDSMSLNQIPIKHDFQPIDGEGVWQPVPLNIFPNQIVMAKTFVRTDPTKSYATVALVKMDMKKLKINIEAGTKYPGGNLGNPGPGLVPKDVQQSNNLVAVFNGGFQEKDGHYGMIVGSKTYVPLRRGLATLVMHTNGSVKLVEYEGETVNKQVISIRQNGPMLIKDGQITPFVEDGVDTWGITTTKTMSTWRSGVGIDKDGNLIYAVGGSLVPGTLAKALQEAGAINAMQLDINPTWVRFIVYDSLGEGKYSYHPLLKSMVNGGYDYLHGYKKDFFYVSKSSTN